MQLILEQKFPSPPEDVVKMIHQAELDKLEAAIDSICELQSLHELDL